MPTQTVRQGNTYMPTEQFGPYLETLANPFSFAALALIVLGYFFIVWDKRKDESANKDDGQVGLKLVLYAIGLFSLGIAAGAVTGILGWAIAGAKSAAGASGSAPLKVGIGGLVAGGGGLAAVMLMFLPRTNTHQYPQIERYALGAVAVLTGMGTLMGLNKFLSFLLGAAPGWPPKAHALANLVVMGGVAFLALNRFGSLSGWTAPAKPVMPSMPQGYGQQPGFPQQGQIPQQQQGGYPMPQQQQGGYPPQGGGQMPPQQGGGGYPPQGGGYPPQGGGGGLPPPGGGGYPPR
jgi:hypothetical protein